MQKQERQNLITMKIGTTRKGSQRVFQRHRKKNRLLKLFYTFTA